MFFVFNSMPMFFRFMPRASLVERKMTSGLLFLRCDFAAINTGVSDIPFASLDSVLPVHGAITRMSTSDLGPIGSAPGMVVMGSLPLIAFARSRKSAQLPKRLSVVEARSENIVRSFAPQSFKFSIALNIFA